MHCLLKDTIINTILTINQSGGSSETMSSFWLSWGVTIIVCILFPIARYIEKFRHKKLIQCWVEKEDEFSGNKAISNETEIIGEFKETKIDKERNMYKMIFRHNLKKKIIYSEYNMEEFLADFRRKRYLFIIYDIEAYLYKRPLKKTREVQLEYETKWKVYFLFKAIWQFNAKGLPAAFFFTGLIFSAFFLWDFIAFLIGGLLGCIIALINTILYDKGIIKPKKKTETEASEWVLFPTYPKYKIKDIYRVEGKRKETIERADKQESNWVEFEEEVEGFNNLQKIVLSNKTRNCTYIKVREKELLRTPNEIKMSKHSNLYQMRYLYNQLLSAKENNKRLQKDNRELFERLAYLQETMDKERRKFAMDVLLEQQETGKTFKSIVKQISSDMQLDLNWDMVVERALVKIDELKRDKLYEKTEIIAKILQLIIDKLSGVMGSDVEIRTMLKKLDIKEDDIIGSIRKQQKTEKREEKAEA